MPASTGCAPDFAERGEQRVGVRVADLPEVRVLGRRDQLVAGGQHDRRAVADGRAGSREPAFASSPSSGGPRRLPARTRTEPSLTSSPAGRMCCPVAASKSSHDLAVGLRVLDRHDAYRRRRGSARRSRCCTASPPPTMASGRCPIIARPDHLQLDRRRGGRPATSTARTANPSMPRTTRTRGESVGDDVLGDHAAVRVGQRQLQRCERSDLRREHPLACVLDREQPSAEVVIVHAWGSLGHDGQSTCASVRAQGVSLRAVSSRWTNSESQAPELRRRRRRVRSRTRRWP